MIPGINFLTVKKKQKAKSKKGLIIVRIIAVCYLIIIGALSVLAYYMSDKISLDEPKKKENSLLSRIAPFKSSQAKLFLIKDRVAAISEVIKKREEVEGEEREKRANYERIVKGFKEKITQGVVINTLNVEETSVVLNLSSDSLDKVDVVISGLTSLGQEEIISSLLLDSLSFNKDGGNYSILLSAER